MTRKHAIGHGRRDRSHGLLDMCKRIMVLHVRHRMLRRERTLAGRGSIVVVILVVVIIATLVLEVSWSFVFMGLSILFERVSIPWWK